MQSLISFFFQLPAKEILGMVEDAPEAVKERDVNGELPIHLSLSYKLFTNADLGKTVVVKDGAITVDGCVHDVEWSSDHEDATAKIESAGVVVELDNDWTFSNPAGTALTEVILKLIEMWPESVKEKDSSGMLSWQTASP